MANKKKQIKEEAAGDIIADLKSAAMTARLKNSADMQKAAALYEIFKKYNIPVNLIPGCYRGKVVGVFSSNTTSLRNLLVGRECGSSWEFNRLLVQQGYLIRHLASNGMTYYTVTEKGKAYACNPTMRDRREGAVTITKWYVNKFDELYAKVMGLASAG